MAHSNAYNFAQHQALTDRRVQGLLPFFVYLTRADEKVRPTHAAMHRFFAPRNDAIWREWWPPNGYFCRCKVRGVTANTVQTFGIKKDAWPKLGLTRDGRPTRRQLRVHPDKGFEGTPRAEIAKNAGRDQMRSLTQARRGR